jgi:hypothetical protein
VTMTIKGYKVSSSLENQMVRNILVPFLLR